MLIEKELEDLDVYCNAPSLHVSAFESWKQSIIELVSIIKGLKVEKEKLRHALSKAHKEKYNLIKSYEGKLQHQVKRVQDLKVKNEMLTKKIHQLPFEECAEDVSLDDNFDKDDIEETRRDETGIGRKEDFVEDNEQLVAPCLTNTYSEKCRTFSEASSKSGTDAHHENSEVLTANYEVRCVHDDQVLVDNEIPGKTELSSGEQQAGKTLDGTVHQIQMKTGTASSTNTMDIHDLYGFSCNGESTIGETEGEAAANSPLVVVKVEDIDDEESIHTKGNIESTDGTSELISESCESNTTRVQQFETYGGNEIIMPFSSRHLQGCQPLEVSSFPPTSTNICDSGLHKYPPVSRITSTAFEEHLGTTKEGTCFITNSTNYVAPEDALPSVSDAESALQCASSAAVTTTAPIHDKHCPGASFYGYDLHIERVGKNGSSSCETMATDCAGTRNVIGTEFYPVDGRFEAVRGDSALTSRKHVNYCDKCQTCFSSSKLFRSHCCGSSEKSFKCRFCQKKFRSQSNLNSHMFYHNQEKNFACRFCKRAFRAPDLLSRHIKTHYGRKPFDCLYCGKKYSRKEHLKYHMRTHNTAGIKMYACASCGLEFATSSELSKHHVIHSKVRPFKCNQCDSDFLYENDLQYHLRAHAL